LDNINVDFVLLVIVTYEHVDSTRLCRLDSFFPKIPNYNTYVHKSSEVVTKYKASYRFGQYVNTT
jgi:hypothetical protein